jgi:hypothetical protein
MYIVYDPGFYVAMSVGISYDLLVAEKVLEQKGICEFEFFVSSICLTC